MAYSTPRLDTLTTSGRLLSRPLLLLHGRREPGLPVAVGMLLGVALLLGGCLAGAIAGVVALLQRW
jgi:hypothetical protein